MNYNGPLIFSGTSNPEFAEDIVKYLQENKVSKLAPSEAMDETNIIRLGKKDFRKFSDGEIWFKLEENVRGRDVYLVQPTQPPAQNIMELLIMIDAAKRASARRVTAVVPYFGYARQDRKDQPRVSVTAKLVANLITTAGADRVITMDLHAPQIQGFFDIPFDHLEASRIFRSDFKSKAGNLVVASADVGGVKLARKYASYFGVDMAVVDKRRPRQNQVEIMNVIGNVEGKDVLIVDDLIDTGGTFVQCVNVMKEKGANKVYGAITHPLLSGEAIEKIENSELEELHVTDTIPLSSKAEQLDKIKVKTATGVFAEAIWRCNTNESISSLFEDEKS